MQRRREMIVMSVFFFAPLRLREKIIFICSDALWRKQTLVSYMQESQIYQEIIVYTASIRKLAIEFSVADGGFVTN